MKQATLHKFLAIIIMILLFVPIAQESTGIFKSKPLIGEYNNPQQPKFSVTNWVNKQYQDSAENYIRLNFGFSSFLTRLHNQYIYCFFNMTRNPSTVIGKKNEIYDYGHVQSYLGNDFIGESAIKEKVNKIEEINQVLQLFKTEIVIVIAPSKPSFAPEYLPDTYKKTDKFTNYSYYQSVLEKSSLAFVDFAKVFRIWKTNQAFPLYPQCGVHWSEYGATLAADSMLKYINEHCQVSLPELNIDTIIKTNQLSKSDYDMGGTLNLLYPIKPYPMGYPKTSIDAKIPKSLNLLTIGDSYYWIWYNVVGFANNFFNRSLFLEYYSKAHSTEWNPKDVKSINVLEETTQSDLILIVCSESNLYRLGYGYIEEIYQLIPSLHQLYKAKIEQYKSDMMKDSDWFADIKQKALIQQISIDSMLTRDAIYLIDHEKSKKSTPME